MTKSIFSLILCSLTALCVIHIDFVWVANPILAEGNTNHIPVEWQRWSQRPGEKNKHTHKAKKTQKNNNGKQILFIIGFVEREQI